MSQASTDSQQKICTFNFINWEVSIPSSELILMLTIPIENHGCKLRECSQRLGTPSIKDTILFITFTLPSNE